MYKYFITCPKYVENLLADELSLLGGSELKQTIGGVHATGDLAFGYRACLRSRLANRVLLILKTGTINNADELYLLVHSIDWLAHLSPQSTLWIEFNGEHPNIRNTMFGAQKVKDAIVDQIREKTQSRPSIEKEEPDVTINVYLDKQAMVTISLDFSGESLHRRSYRLEASRAPLKENLTAAILLRAKWPQYAAQGLPIIDPLCGSATILIEAFLMALDIAPGLWRHYFGFLGWKQHNITLWKQLHTDAVIHKDQALKQPMPRFIGFDADEESIKRAQSNLKQIELLPFFELSVAELANWHKPADLTSGLIITNPPYGERLSDAATLTFLYQHLALKVKSEFQGFELAVLTGNPELTRSMKLTPHKKHPFYNGPILCELLLYSIHENKNINKETISKHLPNPTEFLSDGTKMLINRLEKNKKKLSAWIKRENISCYRVYDRDLPEYAAAIDVYGPYIYVQEYKAPNTIDPEKSTARFQEILMAVAHAFNTSPSKIITKERQKQKGKLQYQKMARSGQLHEVSEYDCRFLINLTDYIDTGLFLDHRPVRRLIRTLVPHKSFLNLFCYTATASIHAARAGASQTVSVDLSPTYVKWAKQNFALNGFSETHHQVVENDCFKWLQNNRYKFDVILLDPPTFSNSKRTDTVLDIERDHVELIQQAMRSLKRDGILIFSTNFKKFKLDQHALACFVIEDITYKSYDPDFERNKKMHYCWLIRYPNSNVVIP